MIKYTMHILVGLAIIFVVELIVLVVSSGLRVTIDALSSYFHDLASPGE